MATRKRGSYYWIDFMFNGQRIRKRSPDNSHKGALTYELLLRNRLARGEPLAEAKPEIRYQFKDILLQWLEQYVQTNNKPSDYTIKRYIVNSNLIPYFGDKYIEDIKTYDIEKYKSHLLQQKKLSAKSTNNYMSIISGCLKWAKEMEVISDLPTLKLLKVPPQKYDYLTTEETEQLLKNANGIWYEMILVAVKTGLRFGELLALKWEDINFKKSYLTVNRNIVRNVEVSPKNNKSRTIPLTSSIINLLQNKNKVSVYIFHDANLDHLKYNACLRRLQKICLKAGLRQISWHNLRHSFASHLAENKVSIIAIKELLGHSDIKTTMRYVHTNFPVLKNAIETLEEKQNNNVTILSQTKNEQIVKVRNYQNSLEKIWIFE